MPPHVRRMATPRCRASCSAARSSRRANVGSDQQGRRTVTFTLKDKGRELFSAWTAAHVNQYFAIVLDNVVISAPVINEAIPGGNVQISAGGLGGFSRQEADQLVNVLRFGSLPFPVEELASDTIDPTLGQEFLNASLIAGGIAIFLVILFMLIHYRLPGVVASFALLYYAVLVLALFRLIPVTLTLAGIAGFVLSVGMAVDANILIFERMKEELRSGKSLAQAIEAGFARAWNSHPRLERVEPDHGADPVPVRLIRDPGLRARPDPRRPVLDVHRDRGDPDDPAGDRRAGMGAQGVAVRRDRGRVHRPTHDANPAPPRGARCLTSSASAGGSSSSRR